MRPVATRPGRRGLLLGLATGVVAGLVATAAVSIGIAVAASGAVLPGVTVGRIDLSGLTREAAAQRLESALPSLSSGQATLVIGAEETTVPYADIGRRYETETMVDAALGVGRAGDPFTDGIARLRNAVNPVALPVVVHPYDAEALDRISAEISSAYAVPPVDAAVIAEGTEYTVTPASSGTEVDRDLIRSTLAGAVDNTDPADVRLEIAARSIAPVVATDVAEEAAAAARATVEALPLSLPGASAEESVASFSPETIASWLSFGPDYGGVTYTVHIDEAAVGEAVAALAETVNQDAVNARISVASGGGLGGVIAGQDGRELDVEATTDAVLTALSDRGRGGSVASLAMAVNVTEPALSTAEAQAVLPQMQMISTWTTNYVPGESNGFGNNINIPARDIDGRNLLPGETFSFWGSVGPVTPERGYQYGGVIIGGRSVPGGAIGGGICSTSTTIFNAALRAGLEMGVRANHYYYIDRYPDGLDATVFMDENFTQDMTFRNDTENPIVIRGFGGNGFVTFQLWSVPTGRRVVLTDPVTSNHRTAIDTTQVSTSMAPGTSKRVEFPHDGHDVSRTRFVYDAAGNEIHRNTYFSSYRPVNGVVLVGPASAAAPPADDADAATAAAPAPATP